MAERPPWRGGMDRRADTDQVRRHNRMLVLSAIRRQAPIARVDLGTETHLSPATITAITADLIGENIVETVTLEPDTAADGETSPRPATGRGRPRVMLQLNRRTAYVLAVKITTNRLMLVLADYVGEVAARRSVTLDTLKETRASFPHTLVRAIHDFLGAQRLSLRDLAEIGIAAQGVVDTNRGTIVWSPAFAERDIELVRPVARAFGTRCFISNDGNMIAQALNWSDPATYDGTFAVIFADYGVGMGLFVGGRLHAGAMARRPSSATSTTCRAVRAAPAAGAAVSRPSSPTMRSCARRGTCRRTRIRRRSGRRWRNC
ncbi:N-acetylglucosamine repressor [Methylobrevis pamukkalensis]|uniref:N-acetylglucosamine repressor n=1 Tax=Methylobrevis pamukkalensis TaxID=1439726 RepID=A0A1E3H6I6_9HYPH|nr:N-acetylglucosamine repressor [Methylobrevis pamukkalensis]